MTIYLGIDPGLSGALACWHPATAFEPIVTLEILDMPTLEITTNGKRKRQIDLHTLAQWLDVHAHGVKEAIIEQVGTMPGQGITSAFNFGQAFMAAKAMVVANMVPMRLVHPRVWKKHYGLTADKDAARLKASQLLPQFAHLWARAKDDGRAESVLLALYGSATQ